MEGKCSKGGDNVKDANPNANPIKPNPKPKPKPKPKSKSKPCSYFSTHGRCNFGEACTFLHDNATVVPRPPCTYFSTRGGCNKGEACKFLHDNASVAPRPPCAFFETHGGCKNGEACKFLHEEKDVVSPKQSPLQVKLKNASKPFRILVVGPKGSGKSTLVSMVCNGNPLTSPVRFCCLTLLCVSYTFELKSGVVEIVDTPGFCGSQHEENMAAIVRFCSELQSVNVILLVVNGQSREDLSLLSLCQTLKEHFSPQVLGSLVLTHCNPETATFSPKSIESALLGANAHFKNVLHVEHAGFAFNQDHSKLVYHLIVIEKLTSVFPLGEDDDYNTLLWESKVEVVKQFFQRIVSPLNKYNRTRLSVSG